MLEGAGLGFRECETLLRRTETGRAATGETGNVDRKDTRTLEFGKRKKGTKTKCTDIIHLSNYKHISWRLCKSFAVVGEVVASLQIMSWLAGPRAFILG